MTTHQRTKPTTAPSARKRLGRLATALFVAVTAAAMPGCLRPGDERARLDDGVGSAAITGLAVAVDGGRAAVRTLEPGRLELWAGAPSLQLAINSASAGAVELVIDNAMPGTRVRVTPSGGGAPFDIEATAPSMRPTHLRFDLPLTAGDSSIEVIPPAATDESPWRFAFFADIQTGLNDVGDVFARIAADPQIRFVLLGGDASEDGSRGELEQLLVELQALPVPLYATPGNHELLGDDELWSELYGLRNSSFEYRGVRVTLLDSSHATLDELVYERLDTWLDQGSDELHVVGMHIPPFDPVGVRGGGWRNRREAAALYATLVEHGVDALFAGHIHSYYADEFAGIPTFVSGGGGAEPSERWDSVGRHYLAIDVDPVAGLLQVALVRVD